MTKDVAGPAEPNRHYPYKDAAPLFAESTTAQQVKRWVERGDLAYVQLPGRRVIRGSDINEFLANRRVPAKRSA